jgi:hypothetical protein
MSRQSVTPPRQRTHLNLQNTMCNYHPRPAAVKQSFEALFFLASLAIHPFMKSHSARDSRQKPHLL